MFYMQPRTTSMEAGQYLGPAGVCIQDEPPLNPAKRLGSEGGDPAAYQQLQMTCWRTCVTSATGNQSLPGAAYIDCVEGNALCGLC